MENLCGLTNVKNYLELTDIDVARDALIQDLITAHSVFVENYCARSFTASTYLNEKLTLTDDFISTIRTKHFPVISLISLKDYGTIIPATDYIVNLETGIIRLKENVITESGNYFTQGIGRVEISYCAGYETIPKDLEMAVVQQVAKIYSLKDYDGMKSERIGGYSFNKQEEFLLAGVKAVYERYTRVA